jgi:hypothetical protein
VEPLLLDGVLRAVERLLEDDLRAEACLALDARVFEPPPLPELDAGREVERFDVRDFVWAIVCPSFGLYTSAYPGPAGRMHRLGGRARGGAASAR